VKKENKIVIFTAPVRSGKTTALMNWIADKPGIGGVLAPDMEGLRHVYTLHDRKLHPFQMAADAGDAVRIGRFFFANSAFELIRATLLADLQRNCGWIIIDEIGPLELKGEGYEPAAGEVIGKFQKGEVTGNLLLVVRSPLLEEVMERYGLEECGVVHSREELFRFL